MAVYNSDNVRIAKNTLLLYFRMFLTMLVSLYTVRIVLDTLGTVDYGIYNVVGGIVTMFAFLSGTMASASQRFFAFELGRGNSEQLKKTFSLTITIYILISVLILFLAETVGLWFLHNKMTIPADRMEAANWVYQFSILSFMMTMFTVPYNAAIIAHEKMKVYAYVSIVEVLLKLLIVYILVVFSVDKLKLYSVLMFFVTTVITFIYRFYCKRKYEECRFSFYWDKKLFNEIIGYSGWNLFGALSSIFKNQGINIVLNLFFGPVVNAARGIAYQVNSIILSFGNNFFTAVRPQIIKLYATDQREEWTKLIFQSTKFSYYLLWILSLPILLEPRFILGLWLKEIPSYSIIFIQLVILDSLLELIANPVITLVQASGKIKWYQIIVGGIRILNLPFAYFILKMGGSPELVFYSLILNTIICNIFRFLLVKRMVNFNLYDYMKKVIWVIFIVSVFAFIIPRTVQFFWEGNSIQKSLFVIFVACISSLLSIILLGTTKKERALIYNKLINKNKIK